MRIDRTHRPWGIATVVLAIAATIAYIFYALETPGAPRGGSWIIELMRKSCRKLS